MRYKPEIFEVDEDIETFTINATFFEPNLDKLEKITPENLNHDSLLTTCQIELNELPQVEDCIIIQANNGSKEEVLKKQQKEEIEN